MPRFRCSPARAFLVALPCVLYLMSAAGRATAAPELSPGERLYRRGLSTTGAVVPAIVQGDLRVRGSDMPCVNCHRRSGWGTSEGLVTVPPIVGPVLFAPVTRGAAQIGTRTTGVGTRPAYDGPAALIRAVRDGVDPAGRTLSATMPRYEITTTDAAALDEYLRSLSAERPGGVTDSTIHLATVIAPGVSAERRASMTDVLRAYVRAKNAGTRHETRRREHGPWDMQQHYQNYRDWVLHEWELTGAPGQWRSQLEAAFQRQPVFAIVSGLAEDEWSPIDEFAVAHRIPTILPQTPLAAAQSADSFYTLYFSRGVALEAETLARHLAPDAGARRVLQVSRCGGAGAAAAAALSHEAARGVTVASECIADGAALTTDRWRGWLRGGRNTLVLWLDDRDGLALSALAAEPALLADVQDVFLSSSLLGDDALRLAQGFAGRASLVHPFVAPDQFERHASRPLTWFKANGLRPSDRLVAVNAFFAVTLTADALSMPRALDSREYFLERLEHMAGRSPQRSAYPGVSFDATHRIGSTVCQVIKVPAPTGGMSTKADQ